MKKSFAALMCLVAATSFAGINNVLVSFHTSGPDKYADGTTVVDGEIYALVWTPAGATFAGINADGSAIAPSKIAKKAPIARGGKCPNVTFQIPEEDANANYPGGTWSVVLLDTRRFAADADGKVLLDASGDKVVEGVGGKIGGYGEVADAGTGRMVQTSSVGDVIAGAKAACPDFKVTGFKVLGDKAYIYAKGSLAGVTFGVAKAENPEKIGEAKPTLQYAVGAEQDWVFIAPADGAKNFYKVD